MASFGEKLFGESEKQGATSEDIARAREMFRAYMDWGANTLFDTADTSFKNRKKSAKKLFNLESIGARGSADMLGQGYQNAQQRQALTTMGARNARLGLAPDDRYLAPMEINPGTYLEQLAKGGLPDLEFEKGKRKAATLPDDLLQWGVGT